MIAWEFGGLPRELFWCEAFPAQAQEIGVPKESSHAAIHPGVTE